MSPLQTPRDDVVGGKSPQAAPGSTDSRRSKRVLQRGIGIGVVVAVAIVAFAGTVGVDALHQSKKPLPSAQHPNPSKAANLPRSRVHFTSIDLGGSPSGAPVTQAPPFVTPANPDEAQAPAVPVPGGSIPGFGNFNAVTCTDTTHCLAVGGVDSGGAVAATSSDGGVSWFNQPVPQGSTTLNSVSCGDGQHCAAVGQGVIVSTSDGGNTWSAHTPPTKNITLLGVTCMSSTVCIASGVTPVPNGPFSGQVDMSSDGGKSWSEASMPQGTQALGGVACPTATVCIAVGGSIMVSQDGGATWTPRNIASGLTSALRSVACTSPTHCIAVGANVLGQNNSTLPPEAIVTNDSGATWQHLGMPNNTAFVDKISCVASSQCFAEGSDNTKNGPAAFEASNDGGTTWSQTAPPAGMTQVADLACPVVNHCVAVGRQGNLPITGRSGDGTTWTTTALT